MKGSARNIAISAVLTALAVVLLFLGNILPTGRLALTAAASLFVISAVIEVGVGASVFVFIGSGVLSALILPDKTVVLLFALFFGYYPIVKSFVERIRKAIWVWIAKIAVFNIALSIIWFIFRKLLFEADVLSLNIWIIYVLGNILFVLFDIGLTKLISFYIERISKHIKKDKK